MTPESREWLERYVATLAVALDLDAWRITVRTDPPDDADADAEITPTFGQQSATLRVCLDFFDLTPQRQREVVVHELVHLHFEKAASVIRFGTIKPLGQAAYDVLWASFSQQVEYSVDGLSIAIAPLLPLPSVRSRNTANVSGFPSNGGSDAEEANGQAEGGVEAQPEEGALQATR